MAEIQRGAMQSQSKRIRQANLRGFRRHLERVEENCLERGKLPDSDAGEVPCERYQLRAGDRR